MLFRGMQRIQSSSFVAPSVRRWLLKLMGFQLGRGVRIKQGVSFFTPGTTFGDEAFVNIGCFFDASAPITVGNQVQFGPNVMLITGSHDIGGSDRRAGANIAAPIVIGDGSWIGAGTIVLPGVTIGRGCVVGAGSVVSRDLVPDGLYAGSPARRIRELEAEQNDEAR